LAPDWFLTPSWAANLRLFDAELFLGLRAEAFRSPRRSPYYIHGSVANSRQLLQSRLHLHADVDVLRTALGGQRHIDADILLLLLGRSEVDLVDQPEIDNVHRDFRIIATLQCAQDILFGDRHLGHSFYSVYNGWPL